MAPANVSHEEEYAKVGSSHPKTQAPVAYTTFLRETNTDKQPLQIVSNLANIKNVWGDSSRQYAEADAIAAEYLRTFLGPAKASTELQVRGTAAGDHVLSAEAKTLNLVFRPKVPR
jgi:hypothetical protein